MHAMAGTGRVIAGRYRLEETIGRGAMGTVWRAWDEILDRVVAVKELRISDSLPPEERGKAFQRTHREARTAARLSHPGLVTVFDVAEEDGRPWIIMELVEGSSLDQIIEQDGPLPPHRAAEAGRQLLSALATAHAAGVLHRDVKPSNVLLTDGGRAVLTDFGIATFQGDPKLTQTGMVMGSPGFTAPERIQGNPATPASDLWSLGATLYAAVQGHGPFDKAGGAITTMSAIINTDPPTAPPSAGLGAVIDALLRRNPADRPDAATAARMLGAVGPLPDAPAGGAPSRSSRRGGRSQGRRVSTARRTRAMARGRPARTALQGLAFQDSAAGPAEPSSSPNPAGAGAPPAPVAGPQDARITGLLGSAAAAGRTGRSGRPRVAGHSGPRRFGGRRGRARRHAGTGPGRAWSPGRPQSTCRCTPTGRNRWGGAEPGAGGAIRPRTRRARPPPERAIRPRRPASSNLRAGRRRPASSNLRAGRRRPRRNPPVSRRGATPGRAARAGRGATPSLAPPRRPASSGPGTPSPGLGSAGPRTT